jgi:endonuclease/exonuclease/phosphatase family metal-dependent hydrolase
LAILAVVLGLLVVVENLEEVRNGLHQTSSDIIFLQEVQGVHDRHAGRYHDWPGKPQHEFIADTVWHEVAYGRNATTRHGHHGNAVLSRFPIVAHTNQDISAHAFESRGLLHCEVSMGAGAPALHCLNVHLGLFERGRTWQIRALVDRIRDTVPRDAPMIIAGDFNVAPSDLDVHDPVLWEGKNLASGPERACVQRLLDWGFGLVCLRADTGSPGAGPALPPLAQP